MITILHNQQRPTSPTTVFGISRGAMQRGILRERRVCVVCCDGCRWVCVASWPCDLPFPLKERPSRSKQVAACSTLKLSTASIHREATGSTRGGSLRPSGMNRPATEKHLHAHAERVGRPSRVTKPRASSKASEIPLRPCGAQPLTTCSEVTLVHLFSRQRTRQRRLQSPGHTMPALKVANSFCTLLLSDAALLPLRFLFSACLSSSRRSATSARMRSNIRWQ